MAAAHLLSRDNSVVLFESERRLGGHARTKIAGKRGDQPVDTGFIVYNKVNYPNLVALFDRLQVPVVESDMGFGASCRGGTLQYALRSLDALFAQRGNAISPRFLRMCRDILHFNRHAEAAAAGSDLTIGGLVEKLGLSDWFRDYYLTPISGAIWSTPTQGILDFPAEAMIRFFSNHHLLSLSGQHQWYTVQGGSVEYVRRLQADLVAHGVDLRLGASVQGITRSATGAMVRVEGGEWELFDEVVLATHADDSLRLLADPTPEETAALSAIRYQPNEAVLHADDSVMPTNRKAWASWVYVEPPKQPAPRIALTYWMNSLQPIPKDDPLFVTLNPNTAIDDRLVHDVTTFRHPVFDKAALQAQARIRAGNGARNTWFCGAWMANGFHEDGFASAVEVVRAMEDRVQLDKVA